MSGPTEIIRGAILGFSKRAVLSDGTVNVLFDTTEDYVRNWPGRVTERPIEDATTIADHVVKRQQSVTLKALINATPVTPIGVVSVISEIAVGINERIDQLIDWREKSTELKLLWTEQVDKLIIESMSEQKLSIRNARLFNVTLKRVKIADTDAASLAGTGTRAPRNVETPQ